MYNIFYYTYTIYITIIYKNSIYIYICVCYILVSLFWEYDMFCVVGYHAVH